MTRARVFVLQRSDGRYSVVIDDHMTRFGTRIYRELEPVYADPVQAIMAAGDIRAHKEAPRRTVTDPRPGDSRSD